MVCEFCARRNIATIENAFSKACNSMGYDHESKFNFPMAEDFGKLLENNGFVIYNRLWNAFNCLFGSGGVQRRYVRGNDLVYKDEGENTEKPYYVLRGIL